MGAVQCAHVPVCVCVRVAACVRVWVPPAEGIEAALRESGKLCRLVAVGDPWPECPTNDDDVRWGKTTEIADAVLTRSQAQGQWQLESEIGQ